jgi:hypothetical protein
MKTDANIRRSENPIFVSFSEYRRLQHRDKLIVEQGKNYAIRDSLLRPVHIAWG